jgi:hypothetical protein
MAEMIIYNIICTYRIALWRNTKSEKVTLRAKVDKEILRASKLRRGFFGRNALRHPVSLNFYDCITFGELEIEHMIIALLLEQCTMSQLLIARKQDQPNL